MNILHRDTTENDLYLMTSEEFVMVPAMYSLGKIITKIYWLVYRRLWLCIQFFILYSIFGIIQVFDQENAIFESCSFAVSGHLI